MKHEFQKNEIFDNVAQLRSAICLIHWKCSNNSSDWIGCAFPSMEHLTARMDRGASLLVVLRIDHIRICCSLV